MTTTQDLLDAYQMGRDAYGKGVAVTANPYSPLGEDGRPAWHPNPDRAAELMPVRRMLVGTWLAGWQAAQDEAVAARKA